MPDYNRHIDSSTVQVLLHCGQPSSVGRLDCLIPQSIPSWSVIKNYSMVPRKERHQIPYSELLDQTGPEVLYFGCFIIFFDSFARLVLRLFFSSVKKPRVLTIY